jgi:hypothetical protein
MLTLRPFPLFPLSHPGNSVDSNKTILESKANRDPLSGAPGAHPIGTGVGAALGGTAAGAVAGSVVGPVGAVIGAVVGAVAGGLAGKGVAESIDPTVEDAHWRDSFSSRPYAGANATYDDYGPAYRYGVKSFGEYPGRSFEDAEPQLARDWATARGASGLDWDHAKKATRDAWRRLSDGIERAVPGDTDRDGK